MGEAVAPPSRFSKATTNLYPKLGEAISGGTDSGGDITVRANSSAGAGDVILETRSGVEVARIIGATEVVRINPSANPNLTIGRAAPVAQANDLIDAHDEFDGTKVARFQNSSVGSNAIMEILVRNDATQDAEFFITGSGKTGAFGDNKAVIQTTAANGYLIQTFTSSSLQIGTANTPRFEISSAGDVAIGQSIAPVAGDILHVREDQNTNTRLVLSNQSTGGSARARCVISTDDTEVELVGGQGQALLQVNTGTVDLRIRNIPAIPIIFETNDQDRLTISGGGNARFDGNISAQGSGTSLIESHMIQSVIDDNTVFAAGTVRTPGNLSLFNESDTADSYVEINFSGRTTSTAFARIAAVYPGADESELAFVTEEGGTLAERFRITGTTVDLADDILIKRDVNAGLTASTTQTQGQGPLTAEINEVATVANANDTVTMPSAAAGLKIVIINNGANTLQIFPASGDDLGAGVDTAVTLAAGSNAVYTAYDATNWEAI